MAKEKRKIKKLNKELGVESEEEPVKKEKKEGFDYAEKAYLKSSGIKSDEYDFVKDVMESTGKSLDDVLENKWFQNDLKEMRELKATKEALPSGTKRSSASTRDTVEYWIAKGELPPIDQMKLRRDVVNARIKAETRGSKFSRNSVV